MKQSLQFRYSLAVVCILAAVVGFMGISHLYVFRSLISASTLATAKTVSDALYQEKLKQGEDLAGFLARILVDPVSRSRAQAIDGLIAAALTQPGMVYVVVHDTEGRVIGGAGPGSKRVPGRNARAGALSAGKIVSRADGLALHITAPIMGSGRPLGTVTFGTSLQATKTDVARFGGYIDALASTSIRFFLMLYVGIAMVIVIVGLSISIVMVRDMVHPIRSLERYMRRIGRPRRSSAAMNWAISPGSWVAWHRI
jgi:hypothetical protein